MQIKLPNPRVPNAERVRVAVGARSITEAIRLLLDLAETEIGAEPDGGVLARARAFRDRAAETETTAERAA